MWGLRLSSVLWLSLLAVVLLVLPLVVTSRFAIDIFIRILLFAFIGVAWNLMGGYAKQLSFGHAAYFGLGAYTSTILQIRFRHLALDRHDCWRGRCYVREPADRRIVLPAARAVFRDCHDRDCASVDAAVS